MSRKYKQYLVYIPWGESMPLSKKSFTHLMEFRKDTVLTKQYEQEENPTDTATYFKYLDLMSKKQP